MSNKTKDILDEILDIEETTGELVKEKPKDIIVRDDTLDDVDSDYKFQRENYALFNEINFNINKVLVK